MLATSGTSNGYAKTFFTEKKVKWKKKSLQTSALHISLVALMKILIDIVKVGSHACK